MADHDSDRFWRVVLTVLVLCLLIDKAGDGYAVEMFFSGSIDLACTAPN